MDGFAIAGCAAFFLLFIIIVWQVFHKKRQPQLQSSVLIAESLQPQVVCRSVPCQHPYYRVISEYSGNNLKKENQPEDVKKYNYLIPSADRNQLFQLTEYQPIVKQEEKKKTSKFDYTEWSRSLSLNSISRKSSHTNSSSRRSSTSDLGRAMISTKTKPCFVA